MASRFVGSTLGLFAFSVTVLAGLYVRNPVTVILSRSILALFGFFLLGLVIGGAAQRVVDEHLKTREAEIRKLYPRASDLPEGAPSTGGSAKV